MKNHSYVLVLSGPVKEGMGTQGKIQIVGFHPNYTRGKVRANNYALRPLLCKVRKALKDKDVA